MANYRWKKSLLLSLGAVTTVFVLTASIKDVSLVKPVPVNFA